MKLSKKVTILYSTCDNYSSLWPGFFTLLNRYWKDCDCKIVLNTESRSFKFKDLDISEPLGCEKNISWSTRLYKSLEKVETDYVLMMLDDFYLKAEVNTEVLNDCIDRMDRNKKIKSFVFAWQPGTKKNKSINDNFQKRKRFAPYRINAQIGLWRVSYLKKIIRSNENPWQFEINGSFRSSVLGGDLYSLKKGAPLIFNYDYGFLIIKGKVNQKKYQYFKNNEELELDFPFKTFTEENNNGNRNKNYFLKSVRYLKYFYEMVLSLFHS